MLVAPPVDLVLDVRAQDALQVSELGVELANQVFLLHSDDRRIRNRARSRGNDSRGLFYVLEI